MGDSHEYLTRLAVAPGYESLAGFGKTFVTRLVTLYDLSRLLVDNQKMVVFVENPGCQIIIFRL